MDLETEEVDFKSPENCKLAIVGTKVYALHRGKYQPLEYRYYIPGQMAELEQFLRDFDGIIIGHNILGFDYRALRPLLSLETIIEKTADTLAVLFERNNQSLKGLSLDSLSQVNFTKGKTISSKSVPELWRQGKHQEVIAYNDNDCSLTMGLWWQLVKISSIRVGQSSRRSTKAKIITLSSDDIIHLICRSPQFTFEAWKEKIKRDGYLLAPQYQRHRVTWQEWDETLGEVEPEYESEFYWFYCAHCQRTFLFQSRIQRGYSDFEEVFCPKCKTSFGEIRADLGYVVVGEVAGHVGDGMSQGDIPQPFQEILLEHIEATRPEWDEALLSTIRRDHIPHLDDRCTICERSPLFYGAQVGDCKAVVQIKMYN